MEGSDLYQKFTVIGEVIDDAPYQVDMGNGLEPFRGNISYFDTEHIDIKPLVPLLPFIKNKNSWGYVFRYGFLEIDQESFEIITKACKACWDLILLFDSELHLLMSHLQLKRHKVLLAYIF